MMFEDRMRGLNRLVKFPVRSLTIGFVAFVSSANAGENTHVPEFIKIDLDFQANSYYRLNATNDWVTDSRSWSASVIAGSDTWRIESAMPINATGLWFCDGTNVFYTADIHFLPTNHIIGLARPMSTSTNKSLVVIPGTHPMGDFGVNLIWLAYCSSKYLKATNRLLPLLAAEPRHDLRVFAVEDKTIMSETRPFLPSKIEFFANKTNAAKAAQFQIVFRSVDPVFIPAIAPYGTLLATYQVERFTNYAGWEIPAVFTYAQTNISDSDRSYFVIGRITAINDASEPRPLLEKGKTAFVEDTRFRHPTKLVDSLRYFLTNDVLPATNDQALSAAMEREAEKSPGRR